MTPTNPFVVPLALTGLALVATAVYVLRRRASTAGAHEHVLATLAAATYALAYACELASPSLETKLGWHRVAWVGIALTPYFAALFGLRYLRRAAAPWQRALLALVPVACIVLAFTNGAHHLLETPAHLVHYDGFAMRHQDGAIGFWIFVAWGYSCVLGVVIGYAATWIAGSPIYRRQARALFFATLAPWAANFTYNFGGSPIVELDLTPFAYGLSSLAFTWALLREGLLDLVPVAHDLVVASVDDPILVVDGRDRVLDANPAARALASAAVTHGMSVRAFFAGAPGVLDALESTRERDVRIEGRDFELRTAALPEGEGRVVFLRDITARKRAEAEREEALETAERALRVRAEFIARMSHELRTPLHGILGSVELLRAELDDAALLRLAEAARVAASGLVELVDELLDFERLEGGELALHERPFEPGTIAAEVVESLRAAADAKGVRLSLARPSSPTRLLGDARRIRQVLVNLVGNAIKFVDAGAIEVRVALSPRDEARCALSIEVTDTGPGVPPEALERIFLPFVQLDESPTRSVGGTGLGLAISRRLMEAMGGSLSLGNRREGRGAVASMQVVLARAALDASPSGEPTSAGASSLHGVRVLLVDDHPVGRSVAVAMLEHLGCHVVSAGESASALALVRDEALDLVLLDLHLPGEDGFRVLRRLRDLGLALPVLAFTADGRASIREACLEAGFDEVLHKPIELAQLAARLSAAIGRPRHAPAPELDAAKRVELVALFRSSHAAELRAIDEAAARSDVPALRAIVHGLAGASALLGFREVVAACHAVLSAPEPTHDALASLVSACAVALAPHAEVAA